MRLSRTFRIAAFVIGIAALVPSAALATSQTVVIRNFTFVPQSATINVGESVTWLNNDGFNHTATADAGAFDTGAIPASGNKTVSFAVAGTYAYHCSIHTTMKGTIVVVGAATPPPTPPPTPRPTPPPTPPPTAPPTESPSPSPSPSASPSPSPTASPTPSSSGTPITVPSRTGGPSASPGAGPNLGGGPGPLLAIGAIALAVGLGGLAFYLYRGK
jgi:plastocyanin